MPFVTTVSSVHWRCLSARATWRAVVLASKMTAVSFATSSAAARPIRRLSSTFVCSRAAKLSSRWLRSDSTAPPWVRRTRPLFRYARSVRTVTSETESPLSSATATVPRSWTIWSARATFGGASVVLAMVRRPRSLSNSCLRIC